MIIVAVRVAYGGQGRGDGRWVAPGVVQWASDRSRTRWMKCMHSCMHHGYDNGLNACQATLACWRRLQHQPQHSATNRARRLCPEKHDGDQTTREASRRSVLELPSVYSRNGITRASMHTWLSSCRTGLCGRHSTHTRANTQTSKYRQASSASSSSQTLMLVGGLHTCVTASWILLVRRSRVLPEGIVTLMVWVTERATRRS